MGFILTLFISLPYYPGVEELYQDYHSYLPDDEYSFVYSMAPEKPELKLNQYIKACEAAGVTIPKALNCFSKRSKEVPIYRRKCDGNKQVGMERLTFKGLQAGKYGRIPKCINPAHLRSAFQACAPGSRIQRIENKNGSVCVMLCRHNQLPNAINDPFFDDINMICHQPENGATCFFNTKVNERSDGRVVGTQKTPWHMDQIRETRCVQCHDNDPWIRTPYLDKLGVLPNHVEGQYYVVGAEALHEDPNFWKRYHISVPDKSPAAKCLKCHRIGHYRTALSIGQGDNLLNRITDSKYLSFHWQKQCDGKVPPPYMPPSRAKMSSKQIKDALKVLHDCASAFNSGKLKLVNGVAKWEGKCTLSPISPVNKNRHTE